MKTLRIFPQFLLVVASAVVVVLLIVSVYSDRVSPKTSMTLSYLESAFPVLYVVNLCFIIYWLFLWEWKFLLIGIFSFLLCQGPVKRYFPFHSHKDVSREEALKMLTHNVVAFGYKNHTKIAPDKIIQYIANSDADIVCLQEYATAKSEKNLTASKIYDALSMCPYRSVFYQSSTKFRSFGITVFSKYPLSNSWMVKHDSDYNGSSVHEVNTKGKKLTLINNHLGSSKLTIEDRTRYSSPIKSFSSDELDDLKGAFEQKLGPAFRIRTKQAKVVPKEIKNARGNYVLVCGDFNDTPISYTHRVIQGDLTDASTESGRGMDITYNQNFLWFCIDNILHSPNMTSMNCSVDKIAYSDHYPLWCYLKLE